MSDFDDFMSDMGLEDSTVPPTANENFVEFFFNQNKSMNGNSDTLNAMVQHVRSWLDNCKYMQESGVMIGRNKVNDKTKVVMLSPVDSITLATYAIEYRLKQIYKHWFDGTKFFWQSREISGADLKFITTEILNHKSIKALTNV